MIVLFGLGKTTKKNFGYLPDKNCKLCEKNHAYELLRITTWMTLFFIPVIPYSFKYFLVCPNCERGFEITKDQFNSLRQIQEGLRVNYNSNENVIGFHMANDPYAGKNEVQKNFLMSMEKARKKRENN